MRNLLWVLVIVIVLGAGAYFFWWSGKLRHTTKPQTLEFYVNAVPYTGGPSYMMFDAKNKEQVFWNGDAVTLSSESMKKIEAAAQNAMFRSKASPMYKVKAKFQIKEIKDSNTSTPGAGTVTYYMVDILEVYSASGV